jgi:hypothetical protein
MTYDYLKALWHDARKTSTVVAENGDLYPTKTEEFPVSNVTLDTNTHKNYR